MPDFTLIDQYLETHLPESIAELSVYSAQPSVSAQNWGLEECAELVGKMLRQRGFAVQIIPTGGAPVVFGEIKGRSNKTVLFYNHYDVQPPEPLELWETPPFEPTLREGKLYGRGVADDKGDFASRMLVLDALLAQDKTLPCNIKFVLEGEEETSSKHMHDFVRDHQDLLAADVCIWEGGGVDEQENPTQALGFRGICYVQLSVETASQDVHSGLGGSIFPNAAWRLVWALNTLKGPDEQVHIPGFYEQVLPISRRDMELLQALPDPAPEYRQRYGVKQFLKGLQGGAELRAEAVLVPTCTICGLTSGYQGPGFQDRPACPGQRQSRFPPGAQPDPGRDLPAAAGAPGRPGFQRRKDRIPRRRIAGPHRPRPSFREAGGGYGWRGLPAPCAGARRLLAVRDLTTCLPSTCTCPSSRRGWVIRGRRSTLPTKTYAWTCT